MILGLYPILCLHQKIPLNKSRDLILKANGDSLVKLDASGNISKIESFGSFITNFESISEDIFVVTTGEGISFIYYQRQAYVLPLVLECSTSQWKPIL